MLGVSLTSSTLQRKQGALGIGASRDPGTVWQFDRTLEDPASAIIDALGGRADVDATGHVAVPTGPVFAKHQLQVYLATLKDVQMMPGIASGAFDLSQIC